MGNFLTNFSNKLKKVDTSILNQRPDVLLSNLMNLEYSVSEAWNPEKFMCTTGKTFEGENLHNRLIIYGMFFTDFYWNYFERLTCKIQNKCLPSSGYFHNYPWEILTDTKLVKKRDKRPYISDGAYTKMPKRYRGVFKRYNSIAYVLNTNAAPHKIFIVKPENRPEMESLLLKMAKILDATTPEHSIPNYIVEDSSPYANDITKEQIDIIKELRDICVKLNSITKPGFKHTFAHAGETNRPRHGAFDIYHEYMGELSKKNHYLELQKQINNAKQKQVLKQHAAVSEYNTTRSIIIADAKKQLSR